ncbi:MAG: type II secretion system protein [Burkholderiales bacterium]
MKPNCAHDQGYTYIAALFCIAILSAGLAVVGEVWHSASVREKEKELLFAGDEFRRAIAAHFADKKDADPAKRFPKTLEELLDDSGLPARRYLRKIYRDPMTGKAEWGLVRLPQGGITGVYSLGAGAPHRRANFPKGYESFASAQSYAGWVFGVAVGEAGPVVAVVVPPGEPAPGTPPPPEPPANVPVVDPPKGPRSSRKCEILALNDAEVCQQQVRKWGSAPECEQTAQSRQAACQAGERLPGLYIRYL